MPSSRYGSPMLSFDGWRSRLPTMNPYNFTEMDGRTDSRMQSWLAWATTHAEWAGNVLIYSSIFQSAIAMAKVAAVMALLSISPNLAPVVAFLVTFSIYTHNKLTDFEEDSVNNPNLVAFVAPRRDVLEVLASVAYAVAVALSLLGGPLALLLTLLPGAVAILYSSEWLPFEKTQRLKEVLVVNTASISLAWAMPVAFLPLVFADARYSPLAGIVLVYFLLHTFVSVELFNVRDVAGDRQAGVATLPVVFGIARTRHLLYALDVVAIALLAVASSASVGYLSPLQAAPLALVAVYSLFVTSRLGRTSDLERLGLVRDFAYPLLVVSVLVFGAL